MYTDRYCFEMASMSEKAGRFAEAMWWLERAILAEANGGWIRLD